MKTTKGGKVMNPTDAYRKELRKKELKRNKKERKKVREVGILKKDPETLKEQIDKLNKQKADGALDKARKHKKRQLEDTLNLVMKKRKEVEEKAKEKGETPVMFSHLGPPKRRTTAEEEERAKNPKPEDSVYYHPTLNPTGAPPPGKPPMFQSSIGPRIPLSDGSSSEAASSSQDGVLSDGLPNFGINGHSDGSVLPESLPLPPPPPLPPNPAASNSGISLPPPPPPPPGPLPPKEQIANRTLLPPPPPLHQSAQPPPPDISGSERENNQSPFSDQPPSMDPTQVPMILPPPPPPPGLPPNSTNTQFEGATSDAETNTTLVTRDLTKMVPPPPPPRQQPPPPGPTLIPNIHPDVLPPGIARFPPPPPPPDMRSPFSAPGLASRPAPPGMMIPMIPRPPYGPPPGPPPMMRPPLPPGPPPTFQEDDHTAYGMAAHHKPSYIKSAASTVVKRPLAQHTPELTAMVPASVRVRREMAAPKAKPKASLPTTSVAAPPATTFVKPEPANSSSGRKAGSIDDSYMAFLEDMKALGALEG